MSLERPTPEKMLERVHEEERNQQRGKLKIYLGAAPGVGKTYSMLQDAIAKRSQGLDVVVGVVESHGRKEIQELLKNLEILPLSQIDYHNRKISEFDIDAAFKRSPALILIDEMAHTNAPGSRHNKRWQDIKELIDRGIDVYTTLNVQHIESLNDIVAQITRIQVRETVPDSMLELADSIELVDLSPDDLLKRLQEGKVYIPEQAELAKKNFFRKGNLASLRELALRVTAERVDAQMMHYRHGLGIKHIWPTKERILVCVGPGPRTPRVIRATRRMATRLQAEWIAVYVESPKSTEGSHNKAIQNLRLAEQLGAETKILSGIDIVKEIINFARERNIARIVLGKQIRPAWKDWLFGSLVDELVRNSGEIDIYIIHGAATAEDKTRQPLPTKIKFAPFAHYAISLSVLAITTGINFLLFPYLGLSNLVMIYLLGVVIVALFGRVGPSILASLLSVAAFDFFFLPPRYNLAVADMQYVVTLSIMLIVTLVMSYLTILSRRQAETTGLAKSTTSVLHVLTRQLASTRGTDKLLAVALQYISEKFDSEVLALLPHQNRLTVRARYNSTQLLSAKEQSIAQWVYDLGQNAGLGTDTLSSSDALYVPLLGTQVPVGVLRVRPSDPTRLLAPEQLHFLEACANQIALALEVDHLQDQTRKSELQKHAVLIRETLLLAVSNDVRNPLSAIMSSANKLTEMGSVLDPDSTKKLANSIYNKAEDLHGLIKDLLQKIDFDSKE